MLVKRVLIIYPDGHPPQNSRRMPTRVLPGGTPPPAIFELWFEAEVEDALTIDAIIDIVQSNIIAASPL